MRILNFIVAFTFLSNFLNSERISHSNINSTQDLSSYTSIGSFKFEKSSKNINIYSKENELLFVTNSAYFSSDRTEINTTDFIFATNSNISVEPKEESFYSINDTIAFKNYVFDPIDSVQIKIEDSNCRFPVFLISPNESVIINNLRKGSFEISFSSSQSFQSYLAFLNGLNQNILPAEFLLSKGSEDPSLLFYFCPFFENLDEEFQFTINSILKQEILAEFDDKEVAKSIIEIIQDDDSIFIDKTDTLLSDQSIVLEDIILKPFSISVFEHETKENMKFKTIEDTQNFLIVETFDDNFFFLTDKELKDFEYILKLKNDKLFKKTYFIIKNITNKNVELNLIIGKIINYQKI